MTNPDAGADWDEISPTYIGLGRAITRLLDEHWPNSGVNGWYLADLLRNDLHLSSETNSGGDA